MTSPAALGVPESLRHFGGDDHDALARIDAVRPAEYARSRNALDGAVTGLSPYLAHGVISMPEAVGRLLAKHAPGWSDKLVFELAWREFFQHVWHRAETADAGERDAILEDMAPSVIAGMRYADAVPADLRAARTGVSAIDTAVRVLYATGYLHNHARMWLASYAVHLRKTHWRAGADWMFGHLLDGDLASNHLSWQWVAGTFSSKPYLFNAENVARYAPAEARAAWLSPGTAIDRSYEALEHIAREGRDLGPERGVHEAVDEPTLTDQPTAEWRHGLPALDAAGLRGRAVALVHPWALAPRGDPAVVRIGWLLPEGHASRPWSGRRWAWVLARMAAVCDAVHVGPLHTLPLAEAASVSAQSTRYPGYRQALIQAQARTPSNAPTWTIEPAPRWLPDPPRLCRSFSRFYQEVQRQFATPEAALTAALCRPSSHRPPPPPR